MATSEAKTNGAELTHLHVENAVQRLLGVQTQRSKIKKISLRLCVVCGYSFSDEHHVKPQSSGGKHFESITLCPNHHRYATLLQHMLDSDYKREDIDAFAHRHFDSAFNEKLLNELLDHSYHISSTLTGSFDLWLTQHDRAWEMRKDDDYERET